MSIQELLEQAERLDDLVQEIGDFEAAQVDDLENMYKASAQIISALETNDELRRLVLGASERAVLTDLKTLAVACHRAIPLRERLDNVMGALDWWDTSDMVADLVKILSTDED